MWKCVFVGRKTKWNLCIPRSEVCVERTEGDAVINFEKLHHSFRGENRGRQISWRNYSSTRETSSRDAFPSTEVISFAIQRVGTFKAHHQNWTKPDNGGQQLRCMVLLECCADEKQKMLPEEILLSQSLGVLQS